MWALVRPNSYMRNTEGRLHDWWWTRSTLLLRHKYERSFELVHKTINDVFTLSDDQWRKQKYTCGLSWMWESSFQLVHRTIYDVAEVYFWFVINMSIHSIQRSMTKTEVYFWFVIVLAKWTCISLFLSFSATM